MQIFRSLAGYSYGRADIVRRAMSKKKHDVMERERHNFVYGLVNEDGTVECDGCIKRGVPESVANEIFNDMSSFASYAFNKSHAAAYAYVAYRTAYLKCHYPCEFMAALLSSVLDNSGKVSRYISECNRIGINVLPPSVNDSEEDFTVENGNIRFGLLAVKNLGKNFIRNIEAQRRTGKYTSFYDFCSRLHGADFNKRAIENLIRCGALDGLGANRRQMLMGMGEIVDELDNKRRKNVDGQIGFFDSDFGGGATHEPDLPRVDEFPKNELLAMEKETAGLYLSGHPMAEYRELAASIKCTEIADLLEAQENPTAFSDRDRIKIMGIINSVKKKITKSDSTMAFLTVEDVTGSAEVIVFPKTLAQYSTLIAEGEIAVFTGRADLREDEPPKLICEFISTPREAVSRFGAGANSTAQQTRHRRRGLFIKFPTDNCPELVQAEKLLKIFDGNVPLYYYFEDTKEYKKQPPENFVDVNEPLINELKKLLGEKNVVIQ